MSNKTLVVKISNLFNLENAIEEVPQMQEQLEFITSGCKSISWPPRNMIDGTVSRLNEHEVLVRIGENIMVPLCRQSEVTYKLSYRFKGIPC